MPRTARPTRIESGWRIRWLDHLGKRQSTVLESYRDADQELRRRQAEADDVKRGLRAPPAPEKKTVGDALDYWLTNRAPQKRSGGDDESIIRRHLRPTFGHLRLRDLGVQHVDAFVATRAKLEPSASCAGKRGRAIAQGLQGRSIGSPSTGRRDRCEGHVSSCRREAAEGPEERRVPGVFDDDRKPTRMDGCTTTYGSWVDAPNAFGAKIRT